jgi:alanyl-tRNA synthetase
MLSSRDVRRQFIDFFRDRHGHAEVPSSPVVPHDDPTLLFTNAGMNQFKDVFLATGSREFTRAVDTQKCIRAGGKHNDLEDVGKDTYHHTFFEMLGNWSFGDYFKAQAIAWAWELLTQVWGLDPSRLHASYFQGDDSEGLKPDTEARDLWRQFLPDERIHPGNKKDNFWEMGDTGPCGPCSEIHYDDTPDQSGGPLVNAGDPNVIEIWNLVFIQFNRGGDGKLTPLPARHVDTGMGFERIVRFLQGKKSNYDTDVFSPLFVAIAEVTGAPAYAGSLTDPIDIAYRVIADHIRCLTFALTDGAVPSNEGRGYVLRRILRRAFRHGRQTLGLHEPFLYRLVPAVAEAMGDAFPELKKGSQRTAELIQQEEQSFGRTIDRGIALFGLAAAEAFEAQLEKEGKRRQVAPSDWEQRGDAWRDIFGNWEYKDERGSAVATMAILIEEAPRKCVLVNVPHDSSELKHLVKRFCDVQPQIAAADAFQLYDTYGFPLDLTQVMAEERGMTVDVEGFDKLMAEARQRSRAVGGEADARQSLVQIVQQQDLPATEFVGYTKTSLSIETPLELFVDTSGQYERTLEATAGQQVAVVVSHTPFYAEAGGQVGDTGWIEVDTAKVRVRDTLKVGDVYFHLGEIESGELGAIHAAKVTLKVDDERRRKIMANHTSTHILNRALRVYVNVEADQKGSLVDDEKLRFDFSHHAAVTLEQIEKVQKQANEDIAADLPVYYDYAPQQEALKIKNLRAVFGEKYPPRVRVVSIGAAVQDLLAKPNDDRWLNHSIEFCGGTHLSRTGEAQALVIVSEEAVGKGVRRITALTGAAARQAQTDAQMLLDRVRAIKQAQNSDEQNLPSEIAELSTAIEQATLPATARAGLRGELAELTEIVKQIEKKRSKEAAGQVVEIARKIADEQSGEVIVARVDDADGNQVRTAMDVIRSKHPAAALLLAGVADGKVSIVASVPAEKISKGLKAGDWVREVAKVVGGGGGGRPDMAQAGGKDPGKVDEAIETARAFASQKLA